MLWFRRNFLPYFIEKEGNTQIFLVEYLGIQKFNRKYRQIGTQSKEMKYEKKRGGQPVQFHIYPI